MATTLEEYVQGNYIKFDENNTPITGIYRGNRVEDDPFGSAGEQRIAYLLDIEGKERILTSKSTRLANQIIKKKPMRGDTITITRSGSGFKTDYKIKVHGREEDVKKN